MLDLGAGLQYLRRYLPVDCTYQPCDLEGGAEVRVCDFNRGLYPAVTRRYDVLVASGLLEFLRDPEAFLRRLPSFGDELLLSYKVRPPGERLWRRMQSGILNHLTLDDLESMLDRLGVPWERVATYRHVEGAQSHEQPIYRVQLVSSAAREHTSTRRAA